MRRSGGTGAFRRCVVVLPAGHGGGRRCRHRARCGRRNPAGTARHCHARPLCAAGQRSKPRQALRACAAAREAPHAKSTRRGGAAGLGQGRRTPQQRRTQRHQRAPHKKLQRPPCPAWCCGDGHREGEHRERFAASKASEDARLRERCGLARVPSAPSRERQAGGHPVVVFSSERACVPRFMQCVCMRSFMQE